MAKITLPRNVHFIYEHSLAQLELECAYGLELQCNFSEDPWELTTDDLNGQLEELLNRAAYVGNVDGIEAVYPQLIRPQYRGGKYNITRSENQYLTHWIYPYKGKYHPQMIRALLNVIGATANWRVADPFSGSGTTMLECQLLGIDSVGVDISPLCVLLAKVKTQSWRRLSEIEDAVDYLQSEGPDPTEVDPDEWKPKEVSNFIQVARMVTFSDASRRKRPPASYFLKNLSSMLTSVRSMVQACEQFDLQLGETTVVEGDVRNLKTAAIGPRSVDAIITSPPYSVALDYVQNDAHALRALGYDTDEIREDFIGVRGTGSEKADLYEHDMRKSLRQMADITKPGGKVVIVIGNVTLDGQEVITTNDIRDWAKEAGLLCERELQKIVWGLYNVIKDEKILFFTREE